MCTEAQVTARAGAGLNAARGDLELSQNRPGYTALENDISSFVDIKS